MISNIEQFRPVKRVRRTLARGPAVLERIEKEVPGDDARHLVAFIRKSERGICRE